MQRSDCANNTEGSREFHHTSRVLVFTAGALGLIACLNACSLPGSKSPVDAGQSDINAGTRIQGPDDGEMHTATRGSDNPEPASIGQLIADHEQYEARLQRLEDIVLRAGDYQSTTPGNNYLSPVVRTSPAAFTGPLASRPIEPVVIAQPMEELPATGQTRVSAAVTPAVPEAPATAPVPARHRPAGNTGNWAINLGSYSSRNTADRMLEKFHRQDIAAELVTAVVNNRTMYRVRIPGFQTRQTAVAHAESLQQRLGLADVWIKRM